MYFAYMCAFSRWRRGSSSRRGRWQEQRGADASGHGKGANLNLWPWTKIPSKVHSSARRLAGCPQG
jgi:hypothetical protein